MTSPSRNPSPPLQSISETPGPKHRANSDDPHTSEERSISHNRSRWAHPRSNHPTLGDLIPSTGARYDYRNDVYATDPTQVRRIGYDPVEGKFWGVNANDVPVRFVVGSADMPNKSTIRWIEIADQAGQSEAESFQHEQSMAHTPKEDTEAGSDEGVNDQSESESSSFEEEEMSEKAESLPPPTVQEQIEANHRMMYTWDKFIGKENISSERPSSPHPQMNRSTEYNCFFLARFCEEAGI